MRANVQNNNLLDLHRVDCRLHGHTERRESALARPWRARLIPGIPTLALAPLLSHATVRPQQAGTSFESQAQRAGWSLGLSRVILPRRRTCTCSSCGLPVQAACSGGGGWCGAAGTSPSSPGNSLMRTAPLWRWPLPRRRSGPACSGARLRDTEPVQAHTDHRVLRRDTVPERRHGQADDGSRRLM